VDWCELEHLAELRLGLGVAVDAEVRDPERLADRRLLRLAPLRLLERDRRLRGAALLEVGPALLEEVERLAHRLSEAKAARSGGGLRQAERPQREQSAQALAEGQLLAHPLPQRAQVAPHRPRRLARAGARGEARRGRVKPEGLGLDAELVLDERRQLAQRRALRHLHPLVAQEVPQLL